MQKILELFSGPCSLETEELALEIAGSLIEQLKPLENDVAYTFKGSFDKANRTSIDSYRGPGLEKGLQILEKVRTTYNVPVITDIHLPSQADAVASVVDTVQIPAFLCRQTDLVHEAAVACAKYGKRLKIKKGQFLSPEETGNIVEKAARSMSKDNILLTERGTSFGYNNLIVDMASFQIMKSFGVKAIHDGTHCVQRPGGLGNATGGKREQVKVLSRAAVAAGADGVFLECHPTPEKAKSDAATCLPLLSVGELVKELVAIKKALISAGINV